MGQIECFTQAHVHALHSDRIRLMAGIARQPAPVATETGADHGDKHGGGAPVDFPNSRFEPGRSGLEKSSQLFPGFGIGLVMGDDFGERIQNISRCIQDGRVIIVRGLFRKPG